MTSKSDRPLLIVVSAPSGAGKTTLCNMLLDNCERLDYSVSCTTRAPRTGEIDGQSYHFMDEVEFERRVAQGLFLEHARVHGALYGTLKSSIEDILARGHDVIMDIDVQGAAQIREQVRALPGEHPIRRGFVDIFIAPPSIDELRRRLEGRAKDSAETIDRRVRQAESEMQSADEYRYLVLNDDLDKAYDVLRAIVIAEHHRSHGI
jgi:guanylate kinase